MLLLTIQNDCDSLESLADQNYKPIIVPNSRGKIRHPGSKDLASVHPKCTDMQFINFLQRCLRWDPKVLAAARVRRLWLTLEALM